MNLEEFQKLTKEQIQSLSIEEFQVLAMKQFEFFPDLLEICTEEDAIDYFYEFYHRNRKV